eukprot:gnl/TRDRNA2_/TRDRNA2_192092_c0_seq1.p1 gnl/TRDRNA2_/TRDRNA2_192092_c0~~gnl/TRDRNA2_/TRDRNA2_192092_c0_seq1.p1  ORF type:complete len:482 (-),score=86.26 gnl/TRDRNA2_/TRDRNA2_192092_c0_seq1:54-1499(-)
MRPHGRTMESSTARPRSSTKKPLVIPPAGRGPAPRTPRGERSTPVCTRARSTTPISESCSTNSPINSTSSPVTEAASSSTSSRSASAVRPLLNSRDPADSSNTATATAASALSSPSTEFSAALKATVASGTGTNRAINVATISLVDGCTGLVQTEIGKGAEATAAPPASTGSIDSSQEMHEAILPPVVREHIQKLVTIHTAQEFDRMKAEWNQSMAKTNTSIQYMCAKIDAAKYMCAKVEAAMAELLKKHAQQEITVQEVKEHELNRAGDLEVHLNAVKALASSALKEAKAIHHESNSAIERHKHEMHKHIADQAKVLSDLTKDMKVAMANPATISELTENMQVVMKVGTYLTDAHDVMLERVEALGDFIASIMDRYQKDLSTNQGLLSDLTENMKVVMASRSNLKVLKDAQDAMLQRIETLSDSIDIIGNKHQKDRSANQATLSDLTECMKAVTESESKLKDAHDTMLQRIEEFMLVQNR